MKNLKRSVVSALLVIILALSSVVPSFAVTSEPTSYSKDSNSGTRHVVCTTLNGTSAGSYYTGNYTYDNLSSLSSTSLYNSLQTLMRTTHSYVTSYNNCRDNVFNVDCENNNTNRATTIYTGFSMSSSHWAGTWSCDREHVWPKSLGGDSTTGGGADLHHIRPAEKNVNNTRSSKLYGNADASSVTGSLSSVIGGTYNGTYFEPLDNAKGDVARICLYVYVRWGSAWGASDITDVFQSVDVLLEWCELDPVDTWEMGRNEVVQNIQGNRNVFIDYPELAWLLFGEEIPEGMQTPSGKAMSGSSSGGSSSGGGDTACTHSATEVRGYVSAGCTTTGYTGDTYCKSCNTKISSGTAIAARGHIWGNWQTNDAGTEKTRACSSCGTTQTQQITAACTHTNTEVKGYASATCTAAGYSGDTYCLSCGVLVRAGSNITATGHSWSEWQLGDTEKTRACSSCGTTQTQPIDAPECLHTNTEVRGTITATCGKDGYSGDTYCKDCDEKLTKGKTIPKTGEHSWSELVITVEPTETAKGEGVYTCTGCGVGKTVVVDYAAPEVEATVEETIIAIITKNAFEALLAGYLAGA